MSGKQIYDCLLMFHSTLQWLWTRKKIPTANYSWNYQFQEIISANSLDSFEASFQHHLWEQWSHLSFLHLQDVYHISTTIMYSLQRWSEYNTNVLDTSSRVRLLWTCMSTST